MAEYTEIKDKWPVEESQAPIVSDIEIETDGTITIYYPLSSEKIGWCVVAPDKQIVYTAFDGLGQTSEDIEKFAKHSVQVWRTIFNDSQRTFKYVEEWEDAPSETNYIE